MFLAEEIVADRAQAPLAVPVPAWLGLFDFLQTGMEGAREAREGGDFSTALRMVFRRLRRALPERLKPSTGDDDPHRPDALMADLLLDGRLSLLGQVPRELRDPVDWFTAFSEDPQWTAHLGYFYWSRALARRWAFTGDEAFAEKWFELVGDFLAAMPLGTPVLRFHPARPAVLNDVRTCDNGESTNDSPAHWISLSAEMRASAWLDGLALLARSQAFRPERVFPILASLAGDHFLCMVNNPRANTPNQYFGTSSVLLKLGVALPEMRFASAAFEIGWNRLRHVLASQMFPDGTDLEQSPNYNKAAMVHLFEMIELMDRVGAPDSRKADFRRAAIARARYLGEICSPGLRLPDLAKAHAEDMAPLLAAWAERLDLPDVKWLASRGKSGTPPAHLSAWMPYGGYAVVRDAWGEEASQLFFKAGRLGLGHMHEDALSFTLYLRGRPLLVDSGHFTYTSGHPEEAALNAYAVTSAAHNTALVDGVGQNRSSLIAARFPDRMSCDIPPLDASKLPRLPWRAREGRGFAYL